jgi:hypothetical protein
MSVVLVEPLGVFKDAVSNLIQGRERIKIQTHGKECV